MESTIWSSPARADRHLRTDFAMRLFDDAGRALLIARDDLRRFVLRRDARFRDRGLRLTPRRGTPLFGRTARRAHLGFGRFDVAREAVDVRAALRDRSTDRPQEHDVQQDDEEDEVDDLNDQRRVDREKQGSVT